MLLERAQNSGRFSVLDIKRLAAAERGLFATHRHNLPVKHRAYLRNLALAPLVIIDTNILIDELQYRISEQLGISAEASLDITGHGQFHRILKHCIAWPVCPSQPVRAGTCKQMGSFMSRNVRGQLVGDRSPGPQSWKWRACCFRRNHWDSFLARGRGSLGQGRFESVTGRCFEGHLNPFESHCTP